MVPKSVALLMIFFSIMFMRAASDNARRHGFLHVHASPSRKMIMSMTLQRSNEAWEMKNEMKMKKKDKGYYEELRNVPSGPDPLHHNGNPPNKPRTFP